ncbi:MAG: hypothetical protein V1926_04795 [Candidatus Peregrinibacteria bacterium]
MMISLKRTLATTSSVVTGCLFATGAFANSIFGDPMNIGNHTDVRLTVTSIMTTILSYMALVAVVVIVIAGIRLVISSGDEGAVDKAKKTILYAAIGLILILLASAIVNLISRL